MKDIRQTKERPQGCIHLRRCRFSAEESLQNNNRSVDGTVPGSVFILTAENREASQKRRFLCPARKKAQEYSESLSSIFDAARRKKIPFEAVY
ncbi:MAG: hypothetical protein IKQ36_02040, partial [Clostridia bacterium]|nr:hypothetical protein [Clostridia bacterium]